MSNFVSDYDGNPFLWAILDEDMAEDVARRKLTDDEKEELQRLCDKDSQITSCLTEIRIRFEELVRQALDETQTEFEKRVSG